MIAIALLLQVASIEQFDMEPTAPTAAWLTGVWLHSADSSDLDRVACNSGTLFEYKADGRTAFFEGEGRWRLRNGTLTETITSIDPESGEPELAAEIGKAGRSRLIRLGPHEAVRIFLDGSRDRMLRCRPGDIQ
ncbi:hypothetical protein [Sphingomonas sp.]|uniref:hypothetical protein n=1 Tax=Sphingomonas sp. TaxID=28214 RepID=UPI0035BC3FF2